MVMARLQAIAITALLPIGPPVSRPRTVLITGVNGWYSANQRIAVGIECVETKALPRNGRTMSGVGALLADSTVLAARPRATASQTRARVNRTRMPAAASQFVALVVARKPVSSAIAVTAAIPSTVWITAPPTWPASMLTRAIGIVRNLAMMPSVMSLAMETAVGVVAPTTVSARMPGVTKVA